LQRPAIMETWLAEAGWDAPSASMLMRIGSRLFSAVIFGALVGLERERRGMAAGLRTHMMVCLGAALFTLVPLEVSDSVDLAQVVKGLAAGVGFLGGGAILKLAAEREIKGLTTAASIWLVAAVGMASGAGRMWLALITVVMSLIILALVAPLEAYLTPESDQNQPAGKLKDQG
jgi:putative Mg2+ transporter-C (MgtC) family protein